MGEESLHGGIQIPSLPISTSHLNKNHELMNVFSLQFPWFIRSILPRFPLYPLPAVFPPVLSSYKTSLLGPQL